MEEVRTGVKASGGGTLTLSLAVNPLNPARDEGIDVQFQHDDALSPTLNCFHATGRTSTKERNSIASCKRERKTALFFFPGYLS